MPEVSKFETILQGLKDGAYSTLDVSFGPLKVVTAEKIAKGDTKPTPTLVAPPGLPSGEYTMISIDLDAPLTWLNFLSPVAHWIQTGFKIVEQPTRELKSDTDAIAPWLACGAPPLVAPHRYLFFLYEQKPDLSIPSAVKDKAWSIPQRAKFDVDDMVRQLGLGKLVAVNYFVSN